MAIWYTSGGSSRASIPWLNLGGTWTRARVFWAKINGVWQPLYERSTYASHIAYADGTGWHTTGVVPGSTSNGARPHIHKGVGVAHIAWNVPLGVFQVRLDNPFLPSNFIRTVILGPEGSPNYTYTAADLQTYASGVWTYNLVARFDAGVAFSSTITG